VVALNESDEVCHVLTLNEGAWPRKRPPTAAALDSHITEPKETKSVTFHRQDYGIYMQIL